MFLFFSFKSQAQTINPGEIWPDNNGVHINAHGGGMLIHDGKYYMITSGCTGWDPNAARLLVSDAVMGDWQYVENPCVGEDADITFDSQSTFIFPVQGKEDAFIFMADRWRPQNAINGRYVWLPVQFKENGMPYLEWMDEWSLGFFE